MAESIIYFNSELPGTKSGNWIFLKILLFYYVNKIFLIFKILVSFLLIIPKENQESLSVNWKSTLSKDSK